jgi:hypothetical protein
MQQEIADAVKRAARGLNRLDKFHLMAGVAWALDEVSKGRKVRPSFFLLENKTFRDGRQIVLSRTLNRQA